MRAFAMLWLAACTGGEKSGPPPIDPDSADPGDTATVSQPALESPAEAEDLDASDGVVEVVLTASTATHELVDWRTGETLSVHGYAYNGQTPGPTIRARLGDLLRVTLVNDTDVETTIHWHGVSAPWDMDGISWMQDPILPGDAFTYELTLSQAGTFWYHPHIDTDRQVDLGLYGVLLVEDPAEDGAFDEELVVVLDDWGDRDDEVGEEHEDTGDDAHGHLHGEGLWTLNGLIAPQLPVTAGSTTRVRLLLAANEGYTLLGLADADGTALPLTQVASDQGRLPSAASVDRLLMSPGDRAEVALLPGAQALQLLDHPYDHQGGEVIGDPDVLLDIRPEGEADSAELPALPWEAAAPTEDPGTTDVLYVFQGDPRSGAWFINGEVYPDVTVAELARDQRAIIEVRNVSPTEHPFHLHGMHFEVLSMNGVVPDQRQLEDTVNVPIYGVARLALVADNPGDWMAHCHILPHAHGGMMTVLRVGE